MSRRSFLGRRQTRVTESRGQPSPRVTIEEPQAVEGHDPEPIDPKEFRRLFDRSRPVSPSDNGVVAHRGPMAPPPTTPPAPREDMLTKLREGFTGLNSVLSGIDEKLQAHNETSTELSESVRVLPDMMKELPHASRAGIELLGNITTVLENQNRVSRDMVSKVQQLADKVRQIPDAVNKLNDRLDRHEDERDRLDASLQDVRSSVTEVQAESARLQRQALDEFRQAQEAERTIQQAHRENDREMIRTLAERSGRQSNVLMVLMVVLILAFLGTIGLIVFDIV